MGALVGRAAGGDEGAWHELLDRFAGLVRSVARAHRLSDADAADVAPWLRLLEHLDRLDDPERVGAWLATTARRECLRLLRRSARLVPQGDRLPEPADDAPLPDAALVARERDAALRSAFVRLDRRDRTLLGMLVAEPAPTYQEIGAALAMPIGSIGHTRARALTRLEREVERLGVTAASVLV